MGTSICSIMPFAVENGGFLEFFLSTNDKREFVTWEEDLVDKSFSTLLLSPLWNLLAKLIPQDLAANVLSLAGFLCTLQAWYLTMYSTLYPQTVTAICVVLICAFYCLHSLHSIHAINTRNDTSLSELFGYVMDGLSTVFIALVMCDLLGATKHSHVSLQWYVVQTSQLILLFKHLSAFAQARPLRYGRINGPGEALFLVVVILCARAWLGMEWLESLMVIGIQWTAETFQNLPISTDDTAGLVVQGFQGFHVIIFLLVIMRVLLMGYFPRKTTGHNFTKVSLAICLAMRFVPALAFQYVGSDHLTTTMTDVICDGLFLTVVTSDLIVAKMARRELHPWIVVMSMASVLNQFVIIALVPFYYMCIFGDLCFYMNLPLLTVCRNVYCDGVYDLCHVGHKNLFKNALKFGNRLFVGVCGDKDCSAYKRPPVMNHNERCAEVRACKYVTKVIENAPCFGLTEEFINEHKIHVVAMGQEYQDRWPNPADDKYYRVPREMGIARTLPRSEGISTSDLIARIQNATLEKNKDD